MAQILSAVYIIEAEGMGRFKIGCSTFPIPRMEPLKAASPVPLTMLRYIYHPDAQALERQLHQEFARYRHHGEWFDIPKPLLEELLARAFPGEVFEYWGERLPKKP